MGLGEFERHTSLPIDMNQAVSIQRILAMALGVYKRHPKPPHRDGISLMSNPEQKYIYKFIQII